MASSYLDPPLCSQECATILQEWTGSYCSIILCNGKPVFEFGLNCRKHGQLRTEVKACCRNDRSPLTRQEATVGHSLSQQTPQHQILSPALEVETINCIKLQESVCFTKHLQQSSHCMLNQPIQLSTKSRVDKPLAGNLSKSQGVNMDLKGWILSGCLDYNGQRSFNLTILWIQSMSGISPKLNVRDHKPSWNYEKVCADPDSTHSHHSLKWQRACGIFSVCPSRSCATLSVTASPSKGGCLLQKLSAAIREPVPGVGFHRLCHLCAF